MESTNLPEAIRNSPLLRRKRIRSDQFPDYVSAVVRLFTPQLLPELMNSMIEGVRKKDAKVMRLVAEMYRLVSSSGVNIVNTMIQGQAAVSGPYDRTFDGIVAKLDRAERQLEPELTEEIAE